MKSWKQKDEDEFLEILEKNIGIVIKAANAYTYTASDRDDLKNDIVYELWKSFGTFKGQSAISTWIYRVALNTAMNYRRNRKKESLFTRFEDTKVLENLHWIIEQEETSDSEMLYQCIDHLNALNKAIILLYLDGKSHEEISGITGISKTNVGTRIVRIKEQLKKISIHYK